MSDNCLLIKADNLLTLPRASSPVRLFQFHFQFQFQELGLRKRRTGNPDWGRHVVSFDCFLAFAFTALHLFSSSTAHVLLCRFAQLVASYCSIVVLSQIERKPTEISIIFKCIVKQILNKKYYEPSNNTFFSITLHTFMIFSQPFVPSFVGSF